MPVAGDARAGSQKANESIRPFALGLLSARARVSCSAESESLAKSSPIQIVLKRVLRCPVGRGALTQDSAAGLARALSARRRARDRPPGPGLVFLRLRADSHPQISSPAGRTFVLGAGRPLPPRCRRSSPSPPLQHSSPASGNTTCWTSGVRRGARLGSSSADPFLVSYLFLRARRLLFLHSHLPP